MSFALSPASIARLAGVHADLVCVVERAIAITAQDFAVIEGVRTLDAERRHLADGTSKTLNSKHLVQADGFGHAVDLAPLVAGEPAWDWDGCYAIAAAMRLASGDHGVALRWGGVWDRPLAELAATPAGMKAAHLAYLARVPHALADGPHFELLNPPRKAPAHDPA